MKVIIHMIITPNGMIARGKKGDTSFISKKASRDFMRKMSAAKANLVGSGTYRETLRHGNFPYKGLNVVMTTSRIKSKWGNVIFTDRSPIKAIDLFKMANASTVLVGGGKINSSFMKADLVDEIYLTIEPTIFTNGIKLFDGVDFEARLKLLDVKRLSKDEVQLHYKVIRRRSKSLK
jgi:dihydrofolate reductase